jgi:abortive infection bacteriophage resistance protein
MNYVQNVGNPYVYSIDLAAYGTTALAGEKIRYYYGYGFSMFEDIAKSEFNPNYHLEKIAKIVI